MNPAKLIPALHSDMPSLAGTELESSNDIRAIQEKLPELTIDPEVPLSEFNIQLVEPTVEQSGFIIGGTNPTSTISSLESLNGVSIPELEERMRPQKYSQAGFLGEEEPLVDLLANDNNTVHDSGITHQDIATQLE